MYLCYIDESGGFEAPGYKRSGDELPRLVEPTVFGQSESHAGLQIADLVASAMLYPMACRVYCAGHVSGHDMKRRLDVVRSRYATRLKPLQYLYRDVAGKMRGGVIVSDKLGQKPSRALFELPPR